MTAAEHNALRRSALGSEASGDGTDSAPPAYPTLRSSVRSLRRSGSSAGVLRAPTVPLAVHVQSASMLMSQEPDDLLTPDNSECSEAPDEPSTSGSKCFKFRRASQLAGAQAPPVLCSAADTDSDTSSPSPPPQHKSWSLPGRQLRTIPEHDEPGAPHAGQPAPYSKLIFNPDPLGKGPWQTYAVPDTAITSTLRAYLGAAAISDELDPLRVCDCTGNCTGHPPPDMVAKAVPCYLLDAAVASIPQAELKRLLVVHERRGTLALPGLWSRYRIAVDSALPPAEPSHTYKFKMFRI
jgi:hypothetical protein